MTREEAKKRLSEMTREMFDVFEQDEIPVLNPALVFSLIDDIYDDFENKPKPNKVPAEFTGDNGGNFA